MPLSSLALYLMICSLGASLLSTVDPGSPNCFETADPIKTGCVMRASRAEIFGHPDADWRTADAHFKARDPKDLTSSRLQSELYRKCCCTFLRQIIASRR